MEILQAGNRKAALYAKGHGGPLLVHPVGNDPEAECARMAGLTARYAPGKPFSLLTLGSPDWSGDYSPWPADVPAWGSFSGKGPETLSLLLEGVLPRIAEERRPRCYIGGYSLAGLFSLWAFYETGAFSGCAACSSSLWFPGWEDYARSHTAPVPGVLYLSLGRKEPLTRHPVLSLIGDCLDLQESLAQSDPGICAVEKVLHPGGHGSEADVRTARGFAWLLEQDAAWPRSPEETR